MKPNLSAFRANIAKQQRLREEAAKRELNQMKLREAEAMLKWEAQKRKEIESDRFRANPPEPDFRALYRPLGLL